MSRSRVVSLFATPLLLVSLVGCSGGSDDTADDQRSDPSSETPSSEPVSAEETEAPVQEGETDECRVAASLWADRMADHVVTAMTSAAPLAETLDLSNLEEPASTIKVLCSDAITDPVLQAAVYIADVNWNLGLCGLSDTCNAKQTKKVRSVASKTAPLVGEVRSLIE